MRDVLTTPTETIEADFLALQSQMAYSSVFRTRPERDATLYWSDVPLAMCNVITNTRLPKDRVAERAAELMGPYFQRGLPFCWITTPSTTSPVLEATLAQAGLVATESPAMYSTLDRAIDPRTPPGVVVDIAWPDRVGPVSATIFDGFGLPAGIREGHRYFLEDMDPADNHFFLARSLETGECLSAGTMHRREDSVMLANITTVERVRRRGIGRALTATMLNRARETGATTATLMPTQMGYPMGLDLGFRTRFNLVTWTWQPPA